MGKDVVLEEGDNGDDFLEELMLEELSFWARLLVTKILDEVEKLGYVREAGLDLGGGTEEVHEKGLTEWGRLGVGWDGGWWWWWWVGEGDLWKGTGSFVDRDGAFFFRLGF